VKYLLSFRKYKVEKRLTNSQTDRWTDARGKHNTLIIGASIGVTRMASNVLRLPSSFTIYHYYYYY